MLAVLIAIWQRPEVTGVVMRHYRRMADARKDLLLVAVGSEGEVSRKLAADNGWDYVEAPNQPLSDKLTVGLARCRDLDPSAGLLAMGSDDMVTEPWVDRCVKSTTMLGLKDMYLIRRRPWECLYWPGYVGPRAGESVGAHRFFPRAVLDQMGWELWPSGLKCNLDGNLYRKLKTLTPNPLSTAVVLPMGAAHCVALGISSEVNLTPWRYIVPGANRVSPSLPLARFPRETQSEIMKLRG